MDVRGLAGRCRKLGEFDASPWLYSATTRPSDRTRPRNSAAKPPRTHRDKIGPGRSTLPAGPGGPRHRIRPFERVLEHLPFIRRAVRRVSGLRCVLGGRSFSACRRSRPRGGHGLAPCTLATCATGCSPRAIAAWRPRTSPTSSPSARRGCYASSSVDASSARRRRGSRAAADASRSAGTASPSSPASTPKPRSRSSARCSASSAPSRGSAPR